MRVLIACEFSGVVQRAFAAKGHDAWSCDLLPTQGATRHLTCDVLTILDKKWDMLIGFTPCTYVCSSGLHWNKRRPERAEQTERAIEFFKQLLNAPIKYIALENPIGCLSTRVRKPDQIIQPWQFGHDASKATCLWLKNLPLLIPTMVIKKARYANQTASGQNRLPPSADRWKLRSLTYPGIANAMAEQWG